MGKIIAIVLLFVASLSVGIFLANRGDAEAAGGNQISDVNQTENNNQNTSSDNNQAPDQNTNIENNNTDSNNTETNNTENNNPETLKEFEKGYKAAQNILQSDAPLCFAEHNGKPYRIVFPAAVVLNIFCCYAYQ